MVVQIAQDLLPFQLFLRFDFFNYFFPKRVLKSYLLILLRFFSKSREFNPTLVIFLQILHQITKLLQNIGFFHLILISSAELTNLTDWLHLLRIRVQQVFGSHQKIYLLQHLLKTLKLLFHRFVLLLKLYDLFLHGLLIGPERVNFLICLVNVGVPFIQHYFGVEFGLLRDVSVIPLN